MFGKPIKKEEEKPLTYWQKKELEKDAEAKKRRNIFMSRRSGEEGGTAYQASRSTFAGGEVSSRSRVSKVGSQEDGPKGKGGFGGRANAPANTGFAQRGGAGPAKGSMGGQPPRRPMGF